jgi:hypothetical protein
MARLLATILVGTLGGPWLAAEVRESPPIFRDATKPGVYITFVRMGVRETLHADDSTERVFLRIHNNTRWDLLLDVNGVPKSWGDALPYYDVVEDPEGYPPSPLPRGHGGHVCSIDRLRPGESFLFSVPRAHLGEGLAIQVDFNYSWEADRPNEPRHSVVFYHSDLPEKYRLGERRRSGYPELVEPPAPPEPPTIP